MNVDQVLNFAFPDGEITYSQRDVMLYALGLGLGLGRDDLQFVYEKDLQVLPPFAMVAGHPGSWMATPALGVDYVRLLHAEQSLEVYGPLPVNGRLKPRYRVVGIADKGADKGALVYIEKVLSDAETGADLARVVSGLFCRGDGGCGNHGTAPDAPQPLPDRAPDLSSVRVVDPRAALIYRLSGDYNPLHADPEVAAAAGYDVPILHGLCTMGIAGHGLLMEVAKGDTARFGGFACRFTRPVFPGDTLRTDIWLEPGGARFAVTAENRDQRVLDRGSFTLAGV